ncbi:MAG TPA: YceI family protein [Burkholderiales bacterium]|nr:YceI family protein [Burkholderiales bacterium]
MAALALPASAAETYTIDPRHTFPSFEVRHLGLSTQRGRFNRSSGQIALDRTAKSGWVLIEVDPTSVDTGDAQLEAILRSETFFDAENHRYVYFRSTGMEFEGERLVRVPGELTLLGVTRPLVLTVHSLNCGVNPINRKQTCGADVTATLKRSEFGMSRHIPAVGDEVRLLIQVEATRDE